MPNDDSPAASPASNVGAVAEPARATSWGLLGLIVAATGVHQWMFWRYTADDAYISMRYAENVAHGNGFVFNVGERVEGYTNFLWVVLLAVANRFGFDTLPVTKVLGACCGLLTIWLGYLLARRLDASARWPALAACALLATSPALAAWSVAGLETLLFTVLVTGSLLRYTIEQERERAFPWSALLAALATLTRPDGAILGAVLGVHSVITARQRPILQRLSWLGLFCAIAVPHEIWRWAYYGHPLPNTFYAKTGRGLNQFLGGLLYTSAGIRKHGGILLFVLAVSAWFLAPLKERARPAVAFVVIWLAYNVYKGHDPLSLFRFFVPMLPVVFVLASIVVWRVIRGLLPAIPRAQAGFFLTFALGMVTTNAIMSYVSRNPREQLKEYQLQAPDWGDLVTIANRLHQIWPGEARIAVIDAGAIPYLTGWYTIDRWGLIDDHIAHQRSAGALGEKFDTEYMLSKKPTFIQTHITLAREREHHLDQAWAGDAQLFDNPTFQRDYVRLNDPLLETFYVRRDSGLPSSLMAEPSLLR